MRVVIPYLVVAVVGFACLGGCDTSISNEQASPIYSSTDEAKPVTTFSCTIEDADQWGGLSPLAYVDDSCFVTANSSRLAYSLFVDVRSKAELEEIQLRDGLKLSLSHLKYREELKSQTIAVVSEGVSKARMGRMCEELKEAGFKEPLVVLGGIGALKHEGYAVVGSMATAKHFASITPQLAYEYLNNEKYDKGIWLGSEEAKLLKSIPAELNFTKEIKSKIAKLNIDNRSNWQPILIIGPNALYREVVQRFSGQGVQDVYWVEGGVEAYQQYIHERSSMIAARSDSVKIPPCLRD